jgi:hypothetical protein
LPLFDPQKLRQGYNRVQGEDIFFIGNPGLGLWSHRDKLKSETTVSNDRSF